MEGRIRAFSRNLEGLESTVSDSYEEKSKTIWIYAHIPMYVGLRSRMWLNVTYNNKQGFLRDDLGTSKDNTSPWGPKSLQRDREGHKCVIYDVW